MVLMRSEPQQHPLNSQLPPERRARSVVQALAPSIHARLWYTISLHRTWLRVCSLFRRVFSTEDLMESRSLADALRWRTKPAVLLRRVTVSYDGNVSKTWCVMGHFIQVPCKFRGRLVSRFIPSRWALTPPVRIFAFC